MELSDSFIFFSCEQILPVKNIVSLGFSGVFAVYSQLGISLSCCVYKE